MALIFMDGCDNTNISKWRLSDAANYAAGASKFGTGTITMGYYFSYIEYWPLVAPPSTPRLLLGGWFSTGAGRDILSIKNFDGSESANMSTDGAGRLQIKRWKSGGGGGVALTGSLTLGDGQWHWLDFDITYSDTGSVKVYVDGNVDINVSSVDMLESGTPTVARLRYSHSTIDDIVWYNNESGGLTSANFPLTAMRIDTLRPNGDVMTEFTPSTGSTHYTLVDDPEPNGSTDYVESLVSGQTDLFNFADLTSTPVSIKCVVLNTVAQNSGTGTIDMLPIIKSGSTTVQTPNQTLYAPYYNYQREYSVDPATSAAWTRDGVNAAQFGFKVA